VQYSRRSAVGSESLGDHGYLTDVSTASVGIHECKKTGVSSCITRAARSCRYCFRKQVTQAGLTKVWHSGSFNSVLGRINSGPSTAVRSKRLQVALDQVSTMISPDVSGDDRLGYQQQVQCQPGQRQRADRFPMEKPWPGRPECLSGCHSGQHQLSQCSSQSGQPESPCSLMSAGAGPESAGPASADLQWTKPPEGDPAAAHAARAPAPPLPLGGGGSSLWQQKK
jgi:hypothetical protein